MERWIWAELMACCMLPINPAGCRIRVSCLVGDTIQVKVLKFDRERERVSLGWAVVA
jgi:hypothetical protein